MRSHSEYRSLHRERGESATSLIILIAGLAIFYYIGMFLYDAMQSEKARRAGYFSSGPIEEVDAGRSPEYEDISY